MIQKLEIAANPREAINEILPPTYWNSIPVKKYPHVSAVEQKIVLEYIFPGRYFM